MWVLQRCKYFGQYSKCFPLCPLFAVSLGLTSCVIDNCVIHNRLTAPAEFLLQFLNIHSASFGKSHVVGQPLIYGLPIFILQHIHSCQVYCMNLHTKCEEL